MNFSDFDSCKDFDLLFDDLSSVVDYTSCEDKSSVSSIEPEKNRNVKVNLRKTKYQNKKRKIDVVTDAGDVVKFEAGFPRPRIVRTDIRRSYSTMYTSVFNSGDFGLIFGFFDTFCSPSFAYTMTKENLIGKETTQFSFIRQGIASCAQFWLFHTLTSPDAAMTLLDTNVITTDSDDSSKIVSRFSFKATKIFDCSPIFKDEMIEACGTKCSPAYSEQDKQCIKNSIESTVSSLVKTLSLRPQPLPLESTGELILHLDNEKRLTKIELLARSIFTEQEYRSLISKNLISY